MARVVIIGAGIMGLAAAFEACKQGHQVTVLEAAAEAGGMAAHFSLGRFSTERFYHFLCTGDAPIFELAGELGIAGQLRWAETSMGYYIEGKLHRWGDPLALLMFPHLSLIEKLRYGAMMFISARRDAWPGLEQRSAREWIAAWCGEAVYRKMWHPLFAYKFYEYTDNISAAWIWTRIRRIGRSRKNLFQERLGYFEGGSETLVAALVARIRQLGGEVALGEGACEITIAEGRATGVRTATRSLPAECVISTVPTPYVPALAPGLGEAQLAAYRNIENIGVVCVALRLRKSVTPHFWVNINAPGAEVPGIIEFSNLRPMPDHVVYVPYYMPVHEAKWQWSEAQFIADAMACLARINPAMTPDDLIAGHAARLRHAQPICPPGFASRLPAVQTPVTGLQIADTCFYYPEDRGLAESIRLGRRMALAV